MSWNITFNIQDVQIRMLSLILRDFFEFCIVMKFKNIWKYSLAHDLWDKKRWGFILNCIISFCCWNYSDGVCLGYVHAPLKVARRKTSIHNPWVTNNIRFMTKLRNEALKRFRSIKDPNHCNWQNLIHHSLYPKRELI